jgi:hypothetical protein
MKRWLVAACTGTLLMQAAFVGAQSRERLQATSAEGRWRAVAESGAVAIFDTVTGQRTRTLRALTLDGEGPSAVAEIHHAARRHSFVIAFETLAELWEVSHDPRAEPIYDGFVHDYKMGEGIAIPGFLNPRRTRLEQPLRALALDDSGAFVLGRARDGADGRARLHLVQLDVRRVIARFEVAGDPDLPAAQALHRDGRSLIRVPDRAGGAATVVDVRGARVVPAAD